MIIGYVALDAEGNPYRPSRSGYQWQKGLTNPPRIYSTLKRAEAYSPIGKGAAVYIEETV